MLVLAAIEEQASFLDMGECVTEAQGMRPLGRQAHDRRPRRSAA
jgi:hypothetical protein